MSTRVYKQLQDIDLSQNKIENVSVIENLYSENSNIEINSSNELDLTSDEIFIKNTTSEKGITVSSDTSKIDSDKFNVTSSNVTVTATNDTITSDIQTNNSKTINIGYEYEEESQTKKSDIKVTGKNLNIETGDTSVMDINTINSDDEYIENKIVINNNFKIEWDSSSNSILFTKING